MDTISKDRRRWNMQRIRSKNTSPELTVRSFLHRNGFRFKLHVKDLPGTPDIVLPKYKTIIEVRGCFWHRHPGCKYAYSPKTRVNFWKKKFQENVQRDRRNDLLLSNAGFRVLTVWECEISEEFLSTMCSNIKETSK